MSGYGDFELNLSSDAGRASDGEFAMQAVSAFFHDFYAALVRVIFQGLFCGKANAIILDQNIEEVLIAGNCDVYLGRLGMSSGIA